MGAHRGGHGGGVLATGFVLVGNDDDGRAREGGAVCVAPFAGPACVAGGDGPGGAQGFHVLLAFDHVDGVPGGDGGQDFWQPVEHAAGILELPDPLAVHLATLAEVLGRVAHDLVQLLAGFVDIVILGHDLRPRRSLGGERLA